MKNINLKNINLMFGNHKLLMKIMKKIHYQQFLQILIKKVIIKENQKIVYNIILKEKINFKDLKMIQIMVKIKIIVQMTF